jgi:hypothetical protein
MMGMVSKVRSAARWMGFSLAVAATLTPALALAAGPADLYFERSVMTAADHRCRLFTPALGSALAASAAQARGAALRAGVDPGQLAQVKTRAEATAYSQACNSTDIATAAGRVRTAFDGYSRLLRQDYPGAIAGWMAQRAASQSSQVWNLSQKAAFGRDSLTFGLAGEGGQVALTGVTRFADGATPYAARLVIRDQSRAPRAYLDVRQGAVATLPLAARVAPRNLTLAWFAEGRTPADLLLVSQDGKTSPQGYTAWRFPTTAAAAMAELDPREAIQVEFLFNGPAGDVVRTAYVEVGDFAAGRAFLNLAQR